ncbi:MAG: M20/M25/M40 family metallo-hydrolase [Deltaproteobacteria bacterium]|nr:M20/M25/M40 family metallo-hydrolase [Deltaproteobacteria bacterium]
MDKSAPLAQTLSGATLEQELDAYWEREILPTLTEYIRIPNLSPAFDKEWAAHGHMARAVEMVSDWIRRQQVPGCTVKVLRDGARTPVVLADIPGEGSGTVLMYGHLDKQPPMTGWREGLGPWNPVRDAEGRLYGRGGADDGYAAFAAIAAVKALKNHGRPLGRIVVLVECSEESGSPDLPHYVKAYRKELGEPDLVVCLDSSCGNYQQLWSTTSLRGLVGVTVKVEVLSEGVHSGMAGGIVPNPFLVFRQLMDRLEDPKTGVLLPPELHAEIPPARVVQAEHAARVLGGSVSGSFPLVSGAQPLADHPAQLLLNNTWRPALALIGQEGLPPLDQSGNVLLPAMSFRLSLRLPPTVPVATAIAALRRHLETDPPHGARVSIHAGGDAGWDAPPLAPWLEAATEKASQEFFGKASCYLGIGGSIPFMAMIGEAFPGAQFLITGVLGPGSNAHGPNEFIHIPYAKKLTCAVARVLESHGLKEK